MSDKRNPTLTFVDAPGADESEGQTFGRYNLVEKLGEGDFGAVWLAEQSEPARRKVALKIIKLGWMPKRWSLALKRSVRRSRSAFSPARAFRMDLLSRRI